MDEFVEIPNVSTMEKPPKRCEKCDREVTHYVEYIQPDDNQLHPVCWSCRERDEKNYNMKPSYRRIRRDLSGENARPRPEEPNFPPKG